MGCKSRQGEKKERTCMKVDFKYIASFLVVVLLFLGVVVLSGDYIDYRRNYKDFQEYMAQKEQQDNGSHETPETGTIPPETTPQETTPAETEPAVTPEPVVPGEVLAGSHTITDVSGNVLWQADSLTQEEVDAIRGYVAERKEVYGWSNSYEKTLKINELDKLILGAADCCFPNIQITFVGDSVTEGIGGNVDGAGRYISYVNYVQDALRFGTVLNNGKGGRMIANYTGDSIYSIAMDQDQLFNINSQIIVMYAGLNDYLTTLEKKDFGTLDSGSTSGYCGQLQILMNYLGEYYTSTDFFVVTAYPTAAVDNSTEVVGFAGGKPTLNDYLEQQRILAQRNGFHLIELYNIGFMDGNDPQVAANLLSDSLHPNDTGYQILGDHIAAEILLYYLGIE